MDHDSIEVSDAGAQRLARLAEGLTDDQVDALLGAAEARQDGSISRREFAKAAGALGLGGLVGGGGAAAMTGTAKADASTTDSDGKVGGPNDHVDVFADRVDATSVSPDELSGGLTGGSTIDTLDGRGLEFVNSKLTTTDTPGAVAFIDNDELSSAATDVKDLIFRKEFFLTYQSFADKVEIGLDDVVYDRLSNTIGDGTPDGDFSSVSTGDANVKTKQQFAGSDLLKSDSFINTETIGITGVTDQDYTNTNYSLVANVDEWTDLTATPAAATPYIRLITRLKNDTSNETTFAKVKWIDSSLNQFEETGTEVSVTSTSTTLVDTGWVEITDVSDDQVKPRLIGKVSAGTGTLDVSLSGLIIGWRL